MNHQSLKAKLGSRSGVTLVELLVVILIVTILSVTLLPMFKKYVVQAQYAAEPIPLVAHLRTQIGLYQYEHSDLPGKTGVVHTYNVVAAADKVKQYTPVIGGVGCIRNAKTFALQAFTTATGSTSTSEHFMKAMDLTTDELVGRRMTPLHVEYVNFGCNGSSYAYALGVFGDGNDLPKGTGYATFEFLQPMLSMRGVSLTIRAQKLSERGRIILELMLRALGVRCSLMKQMLQPTVLLREGLHWMTLLLEPYKLL